jgi:hypothetical protein
MLSFLPARLKLETGLCLRGPFIHENHHGRIPHAADFHEFFGLFSTPFTQSITTTESPPWAFLKYVSSAKSLCRVNLICWFFLGFIIDDVTDVATEASAASQFPWNQVAVSYLFDFTAPAVEIVSSTEQKVVFRSTWFTRIRVGNNANVRRRNQFFLKDIYFT